MAKVRCSDCVNEDNFFCKIKKSKIKLNKKRLCKDYVYGENKLKKEIDIKTIKVSFAELEKNKKQAKIERKKIQEIVKQQNLSSSHTVVHDFNNSDIKHPLTGDLSRFVSTGVGDNDGN